MPSWKKVITSGSDASLASLFVTSAVTSSIFSGSRYIGASFTGSYTGSLTGALIGTASWAQSASWAPSTSQWTSSGANIYYNIGSVGIGTTNPVATLSVVGSTNIVGATTISGSSFSNTGTFSLQRLTPIGSDQRQIVITSAGLNAANTSTANNIVCIGPFSGGSLTGTGADSIIAIGNNAAGSITTGGAYSIHIGRNSGVGITTGIRNVIICTGDQTNIPSSTTNAIHIVAGGGYEGNDADRVLGSETSQYAFIGGGSSHPEYTRRFYFGGGAFVSTPQNANIDFYAPSATGSSDQQGANFTINAGRGTGAGTPGDFIIATSTTGSSGGLKQTLSNRVWIKGNTGNVGIGSSTPAFKLDMPGIVQARLGNAEIGTTTFNSSYAFFGHETLDHSVANNYALLQDSVGGTYLNAAATKNIEFRISNTAVATILSGGNVGIGTTSPSAYLDVKGLADTAGVISLQLRSGNSVSNFNSNQITFAYSNTAEYRHVIKTRHNSNAPSGNSIDFYTWAHGGATTAIGGQHVMSLDGANVGIGTTSPTAKLHVSSSTGGVFEIDGAGATTILYVTASGNVGIGTITPGATLDVIGNVRATSFTGSFSGSVVAAGSNTQIIYNNAGVLAGSTNLVFNGSNVGIGSASPAFPLDVNGTARVTTLIETSTKILKENIQPYSTDINKFKKLKPVSFNWKDTKKEDIGLIAEDLNKVFPEFVSKDNGKPVGIHYGKLAAIFINVIKEQQERIEALEKQVKKLIK